MASSSQMQKISIAGTDHLGVAVASASIRKDFRDENILIKSYEGKVSCRVVDLAHVSLVSHCPGIYAGCYECCQGAFITVDSAEKAQKFGAFHEERLRTYIGILIHVIPKIGVEAPGASSIIVDDLTQASASAVVETPGLSEHRDIGSGMFLDVARLERRTE
jgi:malate/lactate dehydrogenase